MDREVQETTCTNVSVIKLTFYMQLELLDMIKSRLFKEIKEIEFDILDEGEWFQQPLNTKVYGRHIRLKCTKGPKVGKTFWVEDWKIVWGDTVTYASKDEPCRALYQEIG